MGPLYIRWLLYYSSGYPLLCFSLRMKLARRLVTYVASALCLAIQFSHSANAELRFAVPSKPVYQIDSNSLIFKQPTQSSGFSNSSSIISEFNAANPGRLRVREIKQNYEFWAVTTSARTYKIAVTDIHDTSPLKTSYNRWAGELKIDRTSSLGEGGQAKIFPGTWQPYDPYYTGPITNTPAEIDPCNSEAVNIPVAVKQTNGLGSYQIAEIIEEINSPRLVAIHLYSKKSRIGVGQDDSYSSIVAYERLKMTATEVIEKGEMEDAYAILMTVLLGTIDLGKNELFNLDLKLDNIMVQEDSVTQDSIVQRSINQGSVWKIIDLDLILVGNITRQNKLLGTHGYMAPGKKKIHQSILWRANK